MNPGPCTCRQQCSVAELYRNPHKFKFLVKNVKCKGKSVSPLTVLRSGTKEFTWMFRNTDLPPHQEMTKENDNMAARDHLHAIIP